MYCGQTPKPLTAGVENAFYGTLLSTTLYYYYYGGTYYVLTTVLTTGTYYGTPTKQSKFPVVNRVNF